MWSIARRPPFGNRKASIKMPHTQLEISKILDELHQLAPQGYAVALHLQYTTSKFLFQTYQRDWLDYYSQNGLVMSDPTVLWSFENTGATRWSDLDDPSGVLTKAAQHGCKFGVSMATEIGDSRSMAGFARSDREFTDDEIKQMSESFEQLHVGTADRAQLEPETIQELKKMSILVTHPGS